MGDGPLQHQGEKGGEGGIFKDVAAGLVFAPIHVDAIAAQLQCIKRNTHRHNESGGKGRGIEFYKALNIAQNIRNEFNAEQKTKVQHQHRRQHRLFGPALQAMDQQPAKESHQSRRKQKQCVLPAELQVKTAIRRQQNIRGGFGRQYIDGCDHRQQKD